jgi:hypothetical protein
VISSILCSSAQTALGATRLCSDLFPAHQDSANNLKSTVSADFLQASHLFFAATMTQASNSTSASEKSSLFAKLSSIAKFRQLSQSEFQRWMEQSKLNYVDQTFLRSEPTDRLFRLDQQKMQKLDEANVQMKLSSMQDFLGSENFMDQIQMKNIIEKITDHENRIANLEIKGSYNTETTKLNNKDITVHNQYEDGISMENYQKIP